LDNPERDQAQNRRLFLSIAARVFPAGFLPPLLASTNRCDSFAGFLDWKCDDEWGGRTGGDALADEAKPGRFARRPSAFLD
jgi:hypothetical protein